MCFAKLQLYVDFCYMKKASSQYWSNFCLLLASDLDGDGFGGSVSMRDKELNLEYSDDDLVRIIKSCVIKRCSVLSRGSNDLVCGASTGFINKWSALVDLRSGYRVVCYT